MSSIAYVHSLITSAFPEGQRAKAEILTALQGANRGPMERIAPGRR